MRFTYEERTDVVSNCISQDCVKTTKRLKSIGVWANGALVRRYELEYITDGSKGTKRSLLSSVTQYGSDGTSSLPPTRFEWTDEILRFSSNPVTVQTHYFDYVLGDANNDGRSDIIELRGGNVYVFLSNGAGFEPEQLWGHYNYDDSAQGFKVGDFTGDGRADIVFTHGVVTPLIYFGLLINAGDHFETIEKYESAAFTDAYWPTDLNQDGKADLLMLENGGFLWAL